jgi:hypothetical protein
VAVLIDGRHKQSSFGSSFHLGVSCHLVHVIQCDGVLFVLGYNLPYVPTEQIESFLSYAAYYTNSIAPEMYEPQETPLSLTPLNLVLKAYLKHYH